MAKSKAQKAFIEATETKIKPNAIATVENEEPDYKSESYKIRKIIDPIKQSYSFRFNQITNQIEFKKNTEKEFHPWNPRDLKNLWVELKLKNIRVNKIDLKDMVGSNLVSDDYNPFKEYLYGLPKWDYSTDHIKQYLEQVYLSDEENRTDFILSFKKWFVAYVASLDSDPIVNQHCFVLVGGQGKFKTTFLNNLVPKHLRLDYLFSSKFNFEHKDHYKHLGTKMLINLDELATLSRTDVGVLKTILTDDRIITRFSYGEFDTHMWRRASFCGSTNNEQFLSDETGNRRFLCFKIDNIVLDKDFDLDFIYAQALALYKDGFKFWFDREDIANIEEKNERFFNTTIEQDLIQHYIEKPSEQDIKYGFNVQYKTATDINIWLAGKSNRININETTKGRVGSILRKLGYKQISKRLSNSNTPMKVWCVRYVDTPKFVDELGHLENKQDDLPI